MCRTILKYITIAFVETNQCGFCCLFLWNTDAQVSFVLDYNPTIEINYESLWISKKIYDIIGGLNPSLSLIVVLLGRYAKNLFLFLKVLAIYSMMELVHAHITGCKY